MKEMAGSSLIRQKLYLNSIIRNKREIPHEVVMEILSWLPAHFLLQFKCVSKTLLQSIAWDAHFSKLHYERLLKSSKVSINPSILFVPCETEGQRNNLLMSFDYKANDSMIALDLPFHEGGDYWYYLCAVCNGLLCYFRNDHKEVYIWNPLTKDYINLSCPPTPNTRFSRVLSRYTRFGFGFDEFKNEYKVVRALCEYEAEKRVFHTHISVYTLATDSSWRNLEEVQCFLCSSNQNTPLVNGVFHWLGKRAGPSSFDTIVGFDMKDDVFREMPPPNGINLYDQFAHHEIGELGGFLCIFSRLKNMDVEIWQMKEYGVLNSWTYIFRMARPEHCNHLFYLEAMRMSQHTDYILKLNLQKESLWNQETKTITKIEQLGVKFFYARAYIGSIISPTIINRVENIVTKEETSGNDKGQMEISPLD